MRIVFLVATAALGAMAFLVLAPSHSLQPEKAVATKAQTNNRSLISSLKRQIADEEEALARSVYNHARTKGDVTKGTASYSPENQARAARITELRRRLAGLE